jgi:hypothetical protein
MVLRTIIIIILRPLLFSIYINYVFSKIIYCNFLLFADGMNIFAVLPWLTTTCFCSQMQAYALCKTGVLQIIWSIMLWNKSYLFFQKS